MKEADELGIKYVPYISGFFITIPMEGAQAVCDKLQEDNIFMVPLKRESVLLYALFPRRRCRAWLASSKQQWMKWVSDSKYQDKVCREADY